MTPTNRSTLERKSLSYNRIYDFFGTDFLRRDEISTGPQKEEQCNHNTYGSLSYKLPLKPQTLASLDQP